MAVRVRRASVRDAAALAGLRAGERPGGGDGFVEAFAAWVGEHGETHLPFVAEVAGEVVGMAWLLVAERVPSPDRAYRRFGDVQSVYVLPGMRDRGVGAALLAAVLAEARALGLEHVTVHSSDRAVPLYRRVGFGADRTWLRWLPD